MQNCSELVRLGAGFRAYGSEPAKTQETAFNEGDEIWGRSYFGSLVCQSPSYLYCFSSGIKGFKMATLIEPAPLAGNEASRSAVSWPSIFAGATVMIASTLILVAVGSGLGFAAVSPWPGAGPSITTFAVTAGIWMIITQWLSAFLGGYIAGRLRIKWTGIHTHEVLFRDTAHGLLSWALATVIIAVVALAMASSTVGAASNASTKAVSYAADTMLRSSHFGQENGAVRAELTRLLSHDDGLQSDDRDYVSKVVAEQTGLSQDVAKKRVETAVNSIRDATDKFRKTSSVIALFTALSMLIGAFIASASAAYAGRLRDENADI